MTKPIYGVMAEFDNPTALVNAARAAREKGYRKLDAYSPFPIEELSDALHLHKNKLPLMVLIGGIIGGTLGLPAAVFHHGDLLPHQHRRTAAAQLAVVHHHHVRDDHSLRGAHRRPRPAGLCGLPMPYHPAFNVPRFALASRNRFFLCIESTDPLFDRDKTSRVPGDAGAQRGI